MRRVDKAPIGFRQIYERLQNAVVYLLSLALLDYTKMIVVSEDASVLGVNGCIYNIYTDNDG